MNIRQTLQEIQSWPYSDQVSLTGALVSHLKNNQIPLSINAELVAELEARVDYDIANPRNGCTIEEYWANQEESQ
jgi:hypothetical protein